MTGNREALLVVRNLSKKFGKRLILENINIKVKQGDIFGIIGVSGAGKTTLLELLIGFLKPDKGLINFRVGGSLLNKKSDTNFVEVYENQQLIKHVFGFATQKPSFYDELTVKENLDYFASLYELTEENIQANITTALALVELTDYQNLLAKNLSGGMQKRLDIACSMIHDPDVLILDEPTADLDIVLRKQLWEVIKRIKQNGKTIIISSHHLDEIEQLCDTIAVLHNGTINSQGNVEELRDLYSKHQEIHLQTKKKQYDHIISLIKKQKHYKITKILQDHNKLIIHSADAEKLLHYMIHIVEHLHEEVVDIYLSRPSLNEVFEHLIIKMHHKQQDKQKEKGVA